MTSTTSGQGQNRVEHIDIDLRQHSDEQKTRQQCSNITGIEKWIKGRRKACSNYVSLAEETRLIVKPFQTTNEMLDASRAAS